MESTSISAPTQPARVPAPPTNLADGAVGADRAPAEPSERACCGAGASSSAAIPPSVAHSGLPTSARSCWPSRPRASCFMAVGSPGRRSPCPRSSSCCCKALGLYDRDEHLIHKTTLDEIPALFGIATLTALLLVFSDGLFFSSGLSHGEAFGALGAPVRPPRLPALDGPLDGRPGSFLRSAASSSATLAGRRLAREAEPHDTGPRELVGYVPATAGAQTDADGGSPPSRTSSRCSSRSRSTGSSSRHPRRRRRELCTSSASSSPRASKVSVLPEASRMAGSSVEPDYLTGMTLLGVKRFEIRSPPGYQARHRRFSCAAGADPPRSGARRGWPLAIKIDSRGPVLFRQVRARPARRAVRDAQVPQHGRPRR